MKLAIILFGLSIAFGFTLQFLAFVTQNFVWHLLSGFIFFPLAFVLSAHYLVSFLVPLLWWLSHSRGERLRADSGADKCHWEREKQEGGTPIAIILVHGTFAKDAAWTQFDSTLSQRLSRHGELARFFWSGANCMRSRRIAVSRLRECIHEFAEAGYQHICLIGHSHAGNIVLKACEDPAASKRVSAIVCLSTPFIHAWEPPIRYVRGVNLRLGIFFLSFGAYLPVHILVTWIFLAYWHQTYSLENLDYLVFVPFVVEYLVMLCIALWLSAKMPELKPFEPLSDDIRESVCATPALRKLVGKTLIISNSGDEADGALKIASTVNRYLVRAANIRLSYSNHPRAKTNTPAVISESGGGLMRWVISIVFVQIRLLAAMANMAFGADGLATSNRLFLTSSETPEGTWSHHQFTGADRSGTDDELYHSAVYENPKAIGEVEKWINSRTSQVG